MKNPVKCPVTRAAVAGLAVAGGTAVSALFEGAGGTSVVAQAIAGLAAPFLTDVLGNWMADEAQSPGTIHPNHDLQKLVGNAVQLVLVTAADRQTDSVIRTSLQRLGESSQTAFGRVKGLRRYKRITEGELPKLFATAVRGNQAAREVLTLEDWTLFVNVLARDAKVDNRRAQGIAAESLHGGLYAAIRELLKRDFGGEGRQFAALTLDMQATTLRYLAEIGARQQELAGEIRAVRSSVDAFVGECVARSPHPSELRPSLERVRGEEVKLDQVLAELQRNTGGIAKLMEEFRRLTRRQALQHHLEGRRNDRTEQTSVWRFYILASLIVGGLVLGGVFSASIKSSLDDTRQKIAQVVPAVAASVEQKAAGNSENAPIVTQSLTSGWNLGGQTSLGAASRLGAPVSPQPAAANRPAPDLRKKAELLAKSGNPRESVLGLLTLQRNAEATRLIAEQRARPGLMPEQVEFWMMMDARNLADQNDLVGAIGRYKEILTQFPEASPARIELIDVYMRPYVGIPGRPDLHLSDAEAARRVGDAKPYVDEAITQIRVLLDSVAHDEGSSLSAYLHYRYGAALQFRMRGETKPSPEDSAREFRTAAEQFRNLGMRFMEVVSLHQAAVSDLFCANHLPTSDGTLEKEDSLAFSNALANAVDSLEAALGITIPEDNPHVSQLTYLVRSRLAQAYILNPSGDRAGNIRSALKILKELAELNVTYRLGDYRITVMEIYAYQTLAEFEDRKENLLKAVIASKKQSQFRFNARGEMVYPSPDGSETVSTGRFQHFSIDFAEPAIRFTFFCDWLMEGGSYDQYLRLMPDEAI